MTETGKAAPTPSEQIFGIVTTYWQSRALAVAAELELADRLADGPVSVDALAESTKTESLGLYRLMRALESTGFFTQVSPRVFANTPLSECLRKNVPGSQWAWVRLQCSTDCGVYRSWEGLLDGIRTGRTAFDQAHGSSFWQYLQQRPEQWAVFNEAMRSGSAQATAAVTASYNWGRFSVIADIAGGIGTQLVDILNANP